MNKHSSRSHTIVQFTISNTRTTRSTCLGDDVSDEPRATANEDASLQTSPRGDKIGNVDTDDDGNSDGGGDGYSGCGGRETGHHICCNCDIAGCGNDSSNLWTTTRAKLSLVDLAGSERGGAGVGARAGTSEPGQRDKWEPSSQDEEDCGEVQEWERSRINASLSALSHCISCLGEMRRTHVPFRDNTLTRLLQDSLVGGRTFVIATLRPSVDAQDESISTLNFAARCMRVVARQRVNEVVSDALLLERARRQIVALRRQLAEAEMAAAASSSPTVLSNPLPLESMPQDLQHREHQKHKEDRHQHQQDLYQQPAHGQSEIETIPSPHSPDADNTREKQTSVLTAQRKGPGGVGRREAPSCGGSPHEKGRELANSERGDDDARPGSPSHLSLTKNGAGAGQAPRETIARIAAISASMSRKTTRQARPKASPVGEESRHGRIMSPSRRSEQAPAAPSQLPMPQGHSGRASSLPRGRQLGMPVSMAAAESRKRRTGNLVVGTVAATAGAGNAKDAVKKAGRRREAEIMDLLNSRRGRDLVLRGRMATIAAAASAAATAATAVASAIAAARGGRGRRTPPEKRLARRGAASGLARDDRLASSYSLRRPIRSSVVHETEMSCVRTKANTSTAPSVSPAIGPAWNQRGGILFSAADSKAVVSSVGGRLCDENRLATEALIERFSYREDELLRELETWKARCEGLEKPEGTA
ncbi:unnamed protein product, partial [Hapterophycus canaliculatus]